MAGTYYKYVERDADSQINWAEVGREASGMLSEVNRVREEKKDALAKAQRESLNYIMNSPQGVDQSINSKINNFAHNLMEQKKIDYDLLTRGRMSVRDYTLKQQNQLDGTKNLFEVAKVLQANRQATLDGIAEGKYQAAANIYNGGFVEKMTDLSKVSINVNSPSGEINVGMYEDKEIDGKIVQVLGTNVTTPNMLLGMVAQKIPTFYTDETTTSWVKNMGDKKTALYNAATTAGAGTIFEYLGPSYLGSFVDAADIVVDPPGQPKGKYTKNSNGDYVPFQGRIDPVAKQIAADFNKSIDDLVASKIGGPSNSYNLMGVITADLGKYGADDFTYDIEEAKKDKNKILVKINQSTHQMDLDENGPNYERMKKEANDFVRNQIILKLDEEKSIKTTPQNQLQETAMQQAKAQNYYRPLTAEQNDQQSTQQDAENFAANIAFLQTGTDAEKASSAAYFRARGADIRSNPAGQPAGNYIMTKNGLIAFESKGDVFGQSKGLTGALLSATGSDLPEDMVVNAIKGKVKGRQFNTTYSGTGATIDIDGQVKRIVTKVTDVSLFTEQNSTTTANKIKKEIGKIKGIIIKAEGGGWNKGNEITIKKKGAPDLIINSNESGATAAKQSEDLKDWLEAYLTDAEKSILAGVKAGGKGSASKFNK